MRRTFIAGVLLIAAVLFLGGGAWAQDAVKTDPGPVLRVGITPDSPPMIFRLNGKITGMEADMARLLGEALGRPVQFVEVPWTGEIPALLEGKTDIIMSGMTITDARKVRVNFGEPYFKGGLAAAIRREDGSEFGSFTKMLPSFPAVGALKGTTAEAYIRSHYPQLRLVTYESAKEAAHELKARRIDVFVNDAPAIAWFLSVHEGDFQGLKELLNVEYYGWAVRREDSAFLEKVNAALKKWKSDGTLKKILHRWVPYWENLQ